MYVKPAERCFFEAKPEFSASTIIFAHLISDRAGTMSIFAHGYISMALASA